MSHYAPAAKAKKPLYKRWWVWLVGMVGLIVVGLIVIIGSATGGSGPAASRVVTCRRR